MATDKEFEKRMDKLFWTHLKQGLVMWAAFWLSTGFIVWLYMRLLAK